MRFSTGVYFVTEGEQLFDPETGDYRVSESSKVKRRGNVTDTGNNRMNLLYGSVRRGAKTVRLRGIYRGDFDYLEINGKKYEVSMVRILYNKHVFEVIEI